MSMSLLLGALLKGKLIAFAIGVGILSFVDASWAGPANTLLLIMLTIVTSKMRLKVNDVHEDVSSASAAALAAAEASAHAAVASRDAARVGKDIGGLLRRTDIPRNGEDS